MRAKSIINFLAIAVLFSIGTMGLTPNVAQGVERPYKARLEGLAVGFPCGVYLASGKATHLGKFTETGTYCAGAPVGPGLFPLSGEATQVAANGDTITYTFDEIVDFNTDPFTAIGTFTITGGTGRFEGATGGGTFATVGSFLDEGLGLSIQFDGTIDY